MKAQSLGKIFQELKELFSEYKDVEATGRKLLNGTVLISTQQWKRSLSFTLTANEHIRIPILFK